MSQELKTAIMTPGLTIPHITHLWHIFSIAYMKFIIGCTVGLGKSSADYVMYHTSLRTKVEYQELLIQNQITLVQSWLKYNHRQYNIIVCVLPTIIAYQVQGGVNPYVQCTQHLCLLDAVGDI